MVSEIVENDILSKSSNDMSSYNELIALINGCINRNGVQAITGRVLNGVLRAMVNQLGAGYAMGGVAHPTDDPGTPDAPVCYYASEVGTYTHFGNIQIVPGELALLCFDLTDGWFKETMYEGFESVQATIDGNVGTPAVNVTYVNGVLSFDFSNMKGNTGAAAGFGNVTAAVDGTSGTPGVSVQTDGPNTAKNIAFQFTGLKGETGVTSVIATVDNTSGTPQCAVSLNGQQLTLAFTGLKGAQGDTGVSADYPITIVNNLTTNDPTSALSAAQGVVLDGKVSQLEAKMAEISLYTGNPANGETLFKVADLYGATRVYYDFDVPSGQASYIELMNASDQRISYIGKGSSSSGALHYDGYFDVPSGFSYAKFTTTSPTAGETTINKMAVQPSSEYYDTIKEAFGDIAELKVEIGEQAPISDYYVLDNTVASYSGQLTKIVTVQGAKCALFPVSSLVGKTIFVSARQYSTYSVCYVLSSSRQTDGPLLGNGSYINGVADKLPVTIPSGAEWLFINFDPNYSPKIYYQYSDELSRESEEIGDLANNVLVNLIKDVTTGVYATIVNNALNIISLSSAKVLYAPLTDLVGKIYIRAKRSIALGYDLAYIFVDDDLRVIASGVYTSMGINSYVDVPNGATRVYINADANDNEYKVGYALGNGTYATTQLQAVLPNGSDGKFATASNGSVVEADVDGNTLYRIPVSSIPTSAIYITAETLAYPYNILCVFANRAGTSLKVVRVYQITEYTDYKVTIPDNAFYVYINCKSGITPDIRLTLYNGKLNKYIFDKSDFGKLWGKSCVCFGDSITWYDGHAYNWGKEAGVVAKGYETYMRDCGMFVTNKGESGARIQGILSVIRATDVSGYDFVTLTSGANDSRYQTPVGAISESAPFDESTFIGAFQAAVEYILTNNPRAKLVLMTPIKGWIYYPNGYASSARPLVDGDGIVEKRYADAIKEIAAHYSLPVCDWYNEAGVNLLTRSWFINDPDPDPEETPNPNDLYSLHPTTEGYKRMADILIPFLRSF